MRLGLILLLCLLNTGCALWRRDREEPVENGPRQEKAEPVLKPSEALKPPSLEIASPVSDRFFVRLSAFQAGVETNMRLDHTPPTVIVIPTPPCPAFGCVPPPGTALVAEDDLGLDDQVEQARMEFDFRMGERNHLRIDYFKLNRFGEAQATQPINFGDMDFAVGDRIRTELDWRVLSLTYSYSLFKAERFEAGAGIGVHVIEARSRVSEPGTPNRERFSDVAPFATVAVNASYRISKRWAVTARGQTYEYSPHDDLTGRMSDFHGDIQYRWRKNMAVGIGYTYLRYELDAIPDSEKRTLFDMSVVGPELFFRASF